MQRESIISIILTHRDLFVDDFEEANKQNNVTAKTRTSCQETLCNATYRAFPTDNELAQALHALWCCFIVQEVLEQFNKNSNSIKNIYFRKIFVFPSESQMARKVWSGARHLQIVFWEFDADLLTNFIFDLSKDQTFIVADSVALDLTGSDALFNLIGFVAQTAAVVKIEFVTRFWQWPFLCGTVDID